MLNIMGAGGPETWILIYQLCITYLQSIWLCLS